MIKRLLTLFLVTALIMGISMGCSAQDGATGDDVQSVETANTGSTGKQYTVGITVMAMTGNSFQIDLGNSAKAACEKYGAEAIVQAPQSFGDFAEQLSIVEDFVSKKVDLIILDATHSDSMVPAVEAAEAAGIPVVTMDNDVNSDIPITFVGTGNVEGARQGVTYLLNKIGGKGKLVCIEGEAGSPGGIQRKEGMMMALAEFPDVELVMSQDGHFTEEGGMTVMESALQNHPDVAAVFCANDNSALGAAEACENAGVKPLIMGFDGIPEAFNAIQEGRIDSTVTQFPDRMAEQAVQYGLAYLTYFESTKSLFPKPFPDWVDSGVEVVNSENVSQFLNKA